jgi:hypothetical protein
LRGKMNFVYICRGGDNEELRYSIRSVISNFPDSEIWVVGGIPNWFKGKNISIEQNSGKWNNAVENLKGIVMSNDIPEEFVLMNDDFFIVNKIDSIKYYHEGKIENKMEKYIDLKMDPNYVKKLGSTYAKLQKRGIENPLSYETHTPMIMVKEKLSEILSYCPANLWRSLYGNIYNVGGEEIKDVKVYYRDRFTSISYEYTASDFPFLSTDDESFVTVRDLVLKKKFGKKSKHEK